MLLIGSLSSVWVYFIAPDNQKSIETLDPGVLTVLMEGHRCHSGVKASVVNERTLR